MKFKVIIEKDETDYYVAEIPSLPGCFSQGKTAKEAKENIREAIKGWIEVMNEKAVKMQKVDTEIIEMAL